jgi:arginine deiminase
MFTRDIAVTIKDHILITKAAKEARFRENLLSRFIFNNHPIFKETKEADRLIDLNDLEKFPPSKRAEMVSAEGGDIMMIHEDHLLIGCSERTTAYAFQSIKKTIFEKGLVKNVVQINIPNERSFMHIDTLFTMINHDLVACHKPIVYDGEGSNVIVHRNTGEEVIYASIKDYFINEISDKIDFVFSGGGISPFQEREQWTDSCNLVALRPGVAISYDRNLKTLNAFENKGYKVIDAIELINHSISDSHYVSKLSNTIITIPSAELSRARGGSHCMTCPILRK